MALLACRKRFVILYASGKGGSLHPHDRNSLDKASFSVPCHSSLKG